MPLPEWLDRRVRHTTGVSSAHSIACSLSTVQSGVGTLQTSNLEKVCNLLQAKATAEGVLSPVCRPC
jgi:hypothetical protein